MSLPTPGRLKRRADFLRAGKGVRVHGGLFSLQAGRRVADPPLDADADTAARIGFTVTKKVGNAVERNRIRRRLREAVRLSGALPTAPQTDYVIVARRDALTTSFGRLMSELDALMRRSLDRSGKPKGAGRDRRGSVM